MASVFKKLQLEQKRCILLREHLNRKNNIYLYRFYRELTKNCEALQNTTSARNRDLISEEYRQACLVQSWKGLKKLMKSTLSKVNEIRTIIKTAGFRDYALISKFKAKVHSSKYKIKAL